MRAHSLQILGRECLHDHFELQLPDEKAAASAQALAAVSLPYNNP